jgi:hypothetical protein
LRDSETWCRHIIGQRRTLEMVGSLFLKSDDTRPPPLLWSLHAFSFSVRAGGGTGFMAIEAPAATSSGSTG